MKTYDVNIEAFIPLISPADLKIELPISDASAKSVIEGRRVIQNIIMKKDPRLLVITGPCSIHESDAALEYAAQLKALQEEVKETIFLVMRAYFEKPRTTIGWKGLISDPHLNGSYDMATGIRNARRLLGQITEMGIPTATEILDPVIPQYIAGLICWAAIGARTTESQTHREMASGLSMPVGFKNSTDGGLETALNAMIAAGSPQHFLGIDPNGLSCIVKTLGNPFAHIVLRGGKRPNYDSVSIREALRLLRNKNLNDSIIVDCSHANSNKKYQNQAVAWTDVLNQRLSGNPSIVGMMLESNLNEGQQDKINNLECLKYGVSITDACISWETTSELIRSAHHEIIVRSRAAH
jgi:3-deoxy-7-phosphoheptulonate synthase